MKEGDKIIFMSTMKHWLHIKEMLASQPNWPNAHHMKEFRNEKPVKLPESSNEATGPVDQELAILQFAQTKKRIIL